ncbi:MAG TPA: hypothetical protein VF881_12950 [Polyangiaceae bacterium]
MMRRTSSYSCLSSCFIAAATSAALLTQAAPARADEIEPSPKGIIGGALLGGEVVMLVEAAIGVRSGWAYVIGGVLGAGAGGLGGWQVEKNADAKVSVYMLAGGMALVIPTTVAVLQATSYHAPEDYTEDRPAAGAPVPEPPRPSSPSGTPPGAKPGGGASNDAPRGPSRLHYHWQPAKLKLPAGLLDLDDGAFSLAVPAFEVRPLYRMDELQKYGLEQKHELRVPVFSATF